MRSTYFIIDFSYNPDSTKPLAIFEFGDAFASEYPPDKIRYLFNDLNKLYPESLFIRYHPAGFNLIDLEDLSQYTSFDNEKLFDNKMESKSSDPIVLNQLVHALMENTNNRNENSRTLVLYLGHPSLYDAIYLPTINTTHMKYVNHESKTLNNAFYDKSILAEYAQGSPIFPNTLIFDWSDYNEKNVKIIEAFIAENNAEYYILKPARGTHAKHLNVIKADQLKNTLLAIRQNKTLQDDLLSYRRNGLIIQVCHLSKLLEFKNELFYAKSRAIIRADFHNDNDEPTISVITAYWQLANLPAKHDIQNKTVIANIEANSQGVLEINKEDWANICNGFATHLPTILKKMRTADNENNNYQSIEAILNNGFTSQHLSPRDALSNFFNRQHVLPAGFPYEEQIFYVFSNYIHDGFYNVMVKKLIIDLIGLDKEYKRSVHASNEPLAVFINRALDIQSGNKSTILSFSTPYTYILKREAKALIFLSTAMCAYTYFSYGKSSTQTRISISLTLALLIRVSFYLADTGANLAISFFKRTENKNSTLLPKTKKP